MISKRKRDKRQKRRRISRKREIINASILLILIAIVLRIFVVSPIRVKDGAMQGGYFPGDFLLSSKLSYRFGIPSVGESILFEHPLKVGELIVRRVAATQGQAVEIVGKTVYVDGEPRVEPSTVQHSDSKILPPEYSSRDFNPKQQVPPGYLFVLGDNRDDADDSRDFGTVPISSVRGKCLFVYFSWAPDPNAPTMDPPYIIPAIQLLFYNLFHFPSRVRWDRFFVAA